MEFDELQERSLEIRALLAGYKPKIELNPGEGLEQSLAEAEAIADAMKKGEKGTIQAFVESAKAASVIWSLAETLRPCLDEGLNVNAHPNPADLVSAVTSVSAAGPLSMGR